MNFEIVLKLVTVVANIALVAFSCYRLGYTNGVAQEQDRQLRLGLERGRLIREAARKNMEADTNENIETR